MPNTVVINLGNGDLAQGFPTVTARLWNDRHPRAEQFIGSLPAMPDLAESYRIWQVTYRALCDRRLIRSAPEDAEDELEIATGGITNVSQVSFQALSQQLQQQLNDWLQSEGFRHIERQLRSRLQPESEIRVIFEAADDVLHRLPWHCWDFFRDYPDAEMALSRPEYKRWEAIRNRDSGKKVRVLAIVGDRRGIDVAAERQLLQGLADAEIEFLVAPSRQEFNHQLWDAKGWDLLFFAGHSQTEGETGRIYINENPTHNSLTIEQLEEALRAAVAKGLKLAIFNSCDGVGLAQALGKLYIPQVIVMREPVPNRVAQVFLQHFLAAFATEQLPLYQAMRQVRRRLQGLEDEFPGASWLPVICQNPAVEPATWLQLRGMATHGPEPTAVPTLNLGNNPYKGLLAFDETDGDRYFGRSLEIQTLWSRFRDLHQSEQAMRLLPIYGPSGSGKSSLARAGLLPELGRKPLPWQQDPRIMVLVPGNDSLYALAMALAKVVTDDPNPAEKADEFKRVLCQAESGEFTGLNRIAYGLPEIATRPLIILVDQFEEIYAYEPKGDRLEVTKPRQKFIAERNAFVKNLLYAASDLAHYVSVILTCRSDFLGETQQHPVLNKLFSTQGFLVPIMQPEQLAEAISEPAKRAGYEFDRATVRLLVEQTRGQQGALPLLQFALHRIWEGLKKGQQPMVTLEQIGGVGGALADEAKQLYASLHEDERKIAPRIFLALVQIDDGFEVTRRRARKAELITHDRDIPVVESIIKRFAAPGVRFLVTSFNEEHGEMIEVAHEALIGNWDQLQEWIAECREALRQKRKIEQEVQAWERQGKPKGYLLQGRPLRDAREFMHAHTNNQGTALSSLAIVFIKESLRQQRKGRLKITSIFAIFPLLGTLIIIHLLLLQRANAVLWSEGCGKNPDIALLLRYMILVGQKDNLEQINLCQEDLGSINLTGAELWKADFRKAILDHANLQRSFLRKANFQESNLWGVDFSEADLKEANFKGSFLYEANLGKAKNLTKTQIVQANLCKTTLPIDFDLNSNRDCGKFGF